jgi:hypothetical protein
LTYAQRFNPIAVPGSGMIASADTKVISAEAKYLAP